MFLHLSTYANISYISAYTSI